MTKEHVPVLAGELIDLVDPQPGEVRVDCTVGGGGHARLLADRLGPAGTLIGIDRDPTAEERFAALAAEVPCETRFIRADFVTGLAELRDERLQADIVYLDLGMSSMQVDTWERGFSYSYDAPLDMRMDPDQELTASEIVNTWDERRLARVLREYGEERYATQIGRAIVRARRQRGARRPPSSWSTRSSRRSRSRPSSPAVIPPSGRSRRCGSPSTTSSAQLEQALPEAWELLAPGGRLAAISFHSLEDRLVKRFLVERARGCICPPELPICVCGREPEAELLTRRAVAPTPGEIAANPRSRSAHLRAARKLEV